MATPLRLIIVEDCDDDAVLVSTALRRAGYEPSYLRVEFAAEFEHALRTEDVDVIISDYSLPQFNAPAALEIHKASGRDIPFIVISGSVTEETVLEVMKAGAADYVMKDNLTRLAAAVQRELAEARARRQRALEKKESEEALSRLAAIVESSEDAIIGKTPDGIITSWNAGAQRLYGYSPAEAIGRSMATLVPADRASEEPGALARIQAGEPVEHLGTVRVRKDGSLVDVSLTISPIRNKEGAVIGASHIARDITDWKRAQAALQQSEARFRRMADAAPVMIWIAGVDQRCTYFNNGWLEFTGRTLEQELSYGWSESVHPEDLTTWLEVYENAFDRRESFKREYRLRRSDGVHRWVLDHGIPLFEPGFQGYIGSCIDITDRKVAEEERVQLLAREQAARAEAENANRLKDEFLATLSHELRTPLTVILGWARLCESGQLEGKTLRDGLAVILRNAKAQAQLIEDILDVSRIITGKMYLNVREADLPAIVGEVIKSLAPAADAKRIRVEQHLEADLGSINGDPDRLQQVVWNLLSNAIKFTPQDGLVRVSLERINSHVEFAVTDTGEGIPPEFLPHVFQRFRQADSSSTRHHGGLGLGLAIVRHMVELHGGSVRVESPGPGQGATFTVRLPLTPQPALPLRPPAPSRVETSPEPAPDLAGLHILVVEDEPDSRYLITTILRKFGAAVNPVGSSREALEALETFSPDLLIADLGMPGQDGYFLIGEIRSHELQLPAIALTAYTRPEDRARALAAGFDRHLSKPIDPPELALAVQNLVQVGPRFV